MQREQRELIAEFQRGAINRRTFLRRAMVTGLAAPIVISLLTTGPASAAQASNLPKPSAPRPTGTPVPDTEQILRMVTPSPFFMDPVTYAGDMWQLQVVVFQALTRIDSDGKLVPGVADRWEGSPDAKTWTFYLNPNAKFSDGSPITAQDVKWSWDWMANPKSKCWNPDLGAGRVVGYDKVKQGQADSLEGIVVKDDHTIVFNLSAPFLAFPSVASYFSTAVLKKDNVLSSDQWFQQPVTSGFYKVTQYTPGDQATMTLEPNEYWWREPSKLKKVIVKLIADPQTEFVQYDNNEIDGLPAQPTEFAQAVRPNGPRSTDLFWDTAVGTWFFAPMCNKKPWDDVKVRQAFASAIDLPAVSKAALHSIYPPQRRMLPTGFPCGGDQQWQPTFDPAKAKQLIAESSYGNVNKLPKITFLVSEAGSATGLGTWGTTATAIQAQLQENLGVNVSILRKQFQTGELLQTAQSMDGAVIRLSTGPIVPDPSFMTGAASSTATGNYGRYNNPEVDRLLAAGDSATDPAKRCQSYSKADQIYSSEAAMIAPFQDSSAWFFKPKVRGMSIVLGRFWPSLPTMYIAKE